MAFLKEGKKAFKEDKTLPRANRHFLQGYVYHITHRCHNGEFLLGNKWIKERWLFWLAEAKKRFQLSIFDFTITQNHIHLISFSESSQDAIAKSMHLIAGCTAQEYNQRVDRVGAFWQDRYHATAIDSERYLLNCMLYVDLNMVRANVVKNPSDWPFCGFHEIMGAKARCRFIDIQNVLKFLKIPDVSTLREVYSEILKQKLATISTRQAFWSESLAVGERNFVQVYERALAGNAGHREIEKEDDIHFLRESGGNYRSNTDLEISVLQGRNDFPLIIPS